MEKYVLITDALCANVKLGGLGGFVSKTPWNKGLT